jgi:SAM-dependent methyltransferase
MHNDLTATAVLNLGCGRVRIAEAVNVDVTSDTNPDVVHDLNRRPWPFAANQFRVIHANDVIEHLEDTVGTMEEIYRICVPGAVVNIIVPHFSSAGAYTDPTHRRYFGAFTFDYFAESHPLSFYSRCRFKPRSLNIVFHPSLLNKLVWRLANRDPEAYERRWAWMFPAWFVYVQLEVVKSVESLESSGGALLETGAI